MKNVILERWRAHRCGQTAIVLPGHEVARTFIQIEAEANEVAEYLTGLPPGGVVSLQAPNVPSWPALLLGIWKSGGCALLVDHASSGAARDAAERLCGAVWRIEADEREFRKIRLDYAAADFGGRKADLIKLTSGTSDAPRAILFTAKQLAADSDQICDTMGISDRDLNYGVVAFSHSYGFSNLIMPLLCRGIPLVAARDALPRALLAGVRATGATVLPAVPAVFQALAGVEGKLPSLRLCISAGAPLRLDTARAFRTRFNQKIHTFYGASECGGIAYDASDDDVLMPGFVGQPMRGIEIEPLSGGRIRVRSAAAGLGYFPASSEEWMEGTFCPADLLETTAQGWQIIGRRTDLINVGGKKVNPVEVEEVLLSHPAIRDVVVFGVRCNTRTEKLCACVVGAGSLDLASLRSHCAERLSPWQVPRAIVPVESIPVNARGKVSRADLAQQFAGI